LNLKVFNDNFIFELIFKNQLFFIKMFVGLNNAKQEMCTFLQQGLSSGTKNKIKSSIHAPMLWKMYNVITSKQIK
jgi:hypothetical protein